MRDKLIKAGVSNLREFGYPNCDEVNILTDEIYKNLSIVFTISFFSISWF